MHNHKNSLLALNLLALGLMNCMHIDGSDEDRASATPTARVKTKHNSGSLEDLAFIEPSNSHVYLKCGSGGQGGGFTAATVDAGAFGNASGAYFLGDHHGDGKTDLYFANPSDNTVYIKQNTTPLADSIPTYAAAQILVASNFFGHLSGGGKYFTGDFNGDAKDDLLFIEPSDHSLNVKISNGTGFNAGIITSPTGFGDLNGLYMVADFNGDAKQDVLFADSANNTVAVRLSTGGAFSAASTIVTTNWFGHLSGGGKYLMGDVNGDAKDDLVFVEPANNNVYVKLSSGSSLGATVTALNFGSSPSHYLLKDIDGDGKSDLLLCKGADNSIWAKQTWTATGWSATAVATGSGIFGHLSGGGLFL